MIFVSSRIANHVLISLPIVALPLPCVPQPCVTMDCIESKSARRNARRERQESGEQSVAQLAFDKILRNEGRVGTLCDKVQWLIDENASLRSNLQSVEGRLDEMVSEVALLEKILLFVDVDKLEVAIKGTTMVADLDRCFTTPTRPTKPLQLELNSTLTPCKAPLPLPLDHVVPEKTKQTKILDMTTADTTKLCEKLRDSSSRLASTEAILTSEDFDALQAQVDELSESESERFFHEVSLFVAPCELSGDLELDITASNYQQVLQIINDTKEFIPLEDKWIQCG